MSYFRNVTLWTRLHNYLFEKIYTQTEVIPKVLKGAVVWPVFQRNAERESLLHFLSYTKDSFDYQKNSKNMLFLTGPRSSGKSWFVKNSCKNNKHTILIDNQHINFVNFANQLKSTIIDYILSADCVDQNVLVNGLLSTYSPEYIDLYLNKFMKAINYDYQKHITQVNVQALDWDSGEVDFFTEDAQAILSEQQQLKFTNCFKELSAEWNPTQPKAGMIDVDKLQYEHQMHETAGLTNQVDYLFRMLNYVGGFYDEKFQEIVKPIPRQEVSLVLMNVDKLFEYYPHDIKQRDFLDHLILSTFNSKGIRNHIPIVLESSNCLFYNRDMIEMLGVDLEHILHLDIGDVSQQHIPLQVEGVFSQQQIIDIYNKIGGNLADWSKVTKAMVTDQSFDLPTYLKTEDPVEIAKFHYLLNQVKVSVECSELLDNNTIDQQLFKLIQILNTYKGAMFTGSYFADATLMEMPIVRALQEQAILYHPRYTSRLHYSKMNYLGIAQNIPKMYFPILPVERWNPLRSLRWRDDNLAMHKSFSLDYKKRGSYHSMDALEPREQLQNDQDKNHRPYHEFYI